MEKKNDRNNNNNDNWNILNTNKRNKMIGNLRYKTLKEDYKELKKDYETLLNKVEKERELNKKDMKFIKTSLTMLWIDTDLKEYKEERHISFKIIDKIKCIKSLISFILLIIAVSMVNLFWLYNEYSFHYIFLIGYLLIGIFWNNRIIKD